MEVRRKKNEAEMGQGGGQIVVKPERGWYCWQCHYSYYPSQPQFIFPGPLGIVPAIGIDVSRSSHFALA